VGYEWLLPRSTLSVRSGIGERAQAASARSRPLPVALAARTTGRCTPACHSSSSRLGSGQFCVQPCCALQSAAKVHDQSTGTATPLEPPPQRTLPGTGLHPGARTCSPPLAAASRTEPPNASECRRARAPRESCRLAGGSPCRAGLLRWRTTRVAARPPRGELASRHEPRSRQPTPSRPSDAALPPPFLSLKVMIIGQPQGQLYGVRLGQAQQPALCRREPCSQHETRKGNRIKRRTLPCGMVATAAG
jgi:hypothetical protein